MALGHQCLWVEVSLAHFLTTTKGAKGLLHLITFIDARRGADYVFFSKKYFTGLQYTYRARNEVRSYLYAVEFCWKLSAALNQIRVNSIAEVHVE